MKEKIVSNTFLLVTLITGGVYLFLRFLSPLVTPFVVALLFVTIFGPLLKVFQEKYHIRRGVGAVMLLLMAGCAFVLLLWILVSWIVGSIPQWFRNLGTLEADLKDVISGLGNIVGKITGVDIRYFNEALFAHISDGFAGIQETFMPDVLARSMDYFKGAAKVGTFLLAFIIGAILLAKDYDRIMNRLLDREDCRVVLEVMCGVIRYIATYVKAQLVIMLLISVLSGITLGVSGIRHGIFWGILAGILDAMPFIGTGIVLVPLAVSQLFAGEYALAAVCIVLYFVCIVIREFLEPKLIGERIGVSPIFVLISLYVGIQLFGVWGILKGPLGFVLIYQIYTSVAGNRGNRINSPKTKAK